MRILIAVPTFETIHPETFRAIYSLKGDGIDFNYVKGYDCAKARNEIARMSLDYDYVLMVDSDIIIPPNTLECLLEEPTDICFGVYPRKKHPEETEIFKTGTFDFKNRYTIKEIEELSTNRTIVKGAGFGCALIRTAVFENLDYPWFSYVSYDDNTFLSEDLYFCYNAEGTYQMQVDKRVRCGHIANIIRR